MSKGCLRARRVLDNQSRGAFRRGRLGIAATVVLLFTSLAQAGSAFSHYGPPSNPFDIQNLPNIGTGSFGTSYDVLADGRVIAVTGNAVQVESAVGSNTYDVVATFDAAMGGSVDPSFVRVSPGGTNVAVGGGFGKPVAVFDTASLGTSGSPAALTSTTSGGTTRYYAVEHYDAAWYDDQNLAITFGTFGLPSEVSLLDATSAAASPVNPTIIDSVDGASGGIAFDATGRLFTGNGFDNSPGAAGTSATGTIRAFDAVDWQAALLGTPLDFENDGAFVAELLSANSLDFDVEGNLFVGGGDFGNSFEPFDAGYFAVVESGALTDAIAGLDPITPGDLSELRTFDPEGGGFTTYSPRADAATGELLAGWAGSFGAGDPVHLARTVPEPATLGLLGAFGLCALRRRSATEVRHG